MSHKKRRTKANVNIEKALLSLDFPFKNNKGKNVVLKISNSSHSRSKHIAKQYHSLTLNDIKLIPEALLHPDYVTVDPVVKRNMNYYKRREKGKRITFLKIVTKRINEKEKKCIFSPNNKHIL